MSKSLPYFAFYPKDFIGDSKIQLMNAMERGAYISLLCVAWSERPIASLPDNDMMLARWSCLTIKEFRSHKEMIMAPFELRDDGRWYQKRLESEAAKVEKISETNRRSIEKRWKNIRDTNEIRAYNERSTDVIQTKYHSESESESEEEKEKEKEKENPLTPLKGGVAAQRAKSRAGPPNLEDLISFCTELGLPRTDAEYYDDHWKANGFRVGNNRIKNWKAAIRNHKRQGWLPSQKSKSVASNSKKKYLL